MRLVDRGGHARLEDQHRRVGERRQTSAEHGKRPAQVSDHGVGVGRAAAQDPDGRRAAARSARRSPRARRALLGEQDEVPAPEPLEIGHVVTVGCPAASSVSASRAPTASLATGSPASPAPPGPRTGSAAPRTAAERLEAPRGVLVLAGGLGGALQREQRAGARLARSGGLRLSRSRPAQPPRQRERVLRLPQRRRKAALRERRAARGPSVARSRTAPGPIPRSSQCSLVASTSLTRRRASA